MRFEEKKPPRIFSVGANGDIHISDCGQIYLEPDEQVTFVTGDGKEYDVAAKNWGFYATPSVNGRLKDMGFKTALVKNTYGRYYIMIVDPSELGEFRKYLKEENNEIERWLDEL